MVTRLRDARAPAGADADLSLYTRYQLRDGPLHGGCTLRHLRSWEEVERWRRHAEVWRDPPPTPFRVTELPAAHPVPPAFPGAGRHDVTLDVPCGPIPWPGGRRVALPGTLAYTVHTPHGASVLRTAANVPGHMPVDLLLVTLGELGDLRLGVTARPAGGPRWAPSPEDNVKLLLPDGSLPIFLLTLVAFLGAVVGWLLWVRRRARRTAGALVHGRVSLAAGEVRRLGR